MLKPEIRLGKDDIRHCHFCKYWDADVYKWDIYGRKKLVHKEQAGPMSRMKKTGMDSYGMVRNINGILLRRR